MAKRWTDDEEMSALGYIRGAHTTPPDGRTVGGLRSKFPDEMSTLVVENWQAVPAAIRHRLTMHVLAVSRSAPIALGDKPTSALTVERFLRDDLPRAILRREGYPEFDAEWAAEVRQALFQSARARAFA